MANNDVNRITGTVQAALMERYQDNINTTHSDGSTFMVSLLGHAFKVTVTEVTMDEFNAGLEADRAALGED
jgi:hypothetical protein